MIRVAFVLYFLTLFFAPVTRAQESYCEGSYFNETTLLKHLKSLSSDAFEGRRTGTKGGRKAKQFIVNQFHALNVLPSTKNYEQHFGFTEAKRYYKGINVLGEIKGSEFPEDYIVLSAHYDHEGIINGDIYNGADDNASGVCALFSFAEYFKKHPPKHSIIFAAFDAEELDLQGSKYFVKSGLARSKNIVLNLNLDMVSRSDSNTLFVVGVSHNERLAYIYKNMKAACQINLVAGHDGYDGLENWTYASDHMSFFMEAIPFLYFGVDDHKDYHEPTDTFDRIQPGFYVNAVKTIINFFEKADDFRFYK
ncbi:M28 family peptidase [Tamlana sp. 2_MG-2023]|uniref:M28 family peptidase n=1 Tax=unclassified Tamlana TaxID=2614803 RepID=UPI0026E43B7B|nr:MULTISPECIES: M28 family peptidase [unclassified Tamlana]MDO6760557.1 M28 family peptidase [Tamlana sp. 2_MG-2023]MDO6790813.1 M28 family peptidase [Tamlana sp. 1_MG-2023]